MFSGWLDLERIENVNAQCVSFRLISSHRYHMFNIFCIIARISSGSTSMAFLGRGGKQRGRTAWLGVWSKDLFWRWFVSDDS